MKVFCVSGIFFPPVENISIIHNGYARDNRAIEFNSPDKLARLARNANVFMMICCAKCILRRDAILLCKNTVTNRFGRGEYDVFFFSAHTDTGAQNQNHHPALRTPLGTLTDRADSLASRAERSRCTTNLCARVAEHRYNLTITIFV